MTISVSYTAVIMAIFKMNLSSPLSLFFFHWFSSRRSGGFEDTWHRFYRLVILLSSNQQCWNAVEMAHKALTPTVAWCHPFFIHHQTRVMEEALFCLYNNLKDIFNHSPTKNILNFIKHTNLHNKL